MYDFKSAQESFFIGSIDAIFFYLRQPTGKMKSGQNNRLGISKAYK